MSSDIDEQAYEYASIVA